MEGERAICLEELAQASFQALSPDVDGVPSDRIRAQLDPERFGRRRFDDHFEEVSIQRTWEQRLRENPRLFDAPKFRLQQVISVHDDGHPEEDDVGGTDTVALFRLGLTSYREYLGTNCGPDAPRLRAKGLADHGDPQIFMADPMGVGALVRTSDFRFVFLRRSSSCGEAQGLLDGPGGHAEPEMVKGLLESSSASSKAIVHELFDSIVREVVDEVNIPRSELSEARLLGIIENKTTFGRKSAQFIIRCRLSSSEVLELFNRGTHAEVEESSEIQFFSEQELLDAPTSDAIHWLDFAPAARACQLMYATLKAKSK